MHVTQPADRILRLTKRRWLLVLLALAVPLGVFAFSRWWEGTRNGGQLPAEPFRIAGNFYYVGANDVASFLITGPDGHVLIDGGYPGTASMIIASITRLGFDMKDVKVLLNSEPHYDHAGGLAELQKASGAELWASEASAEAIASGGYDTNIPLPMRAIPWVIRYPAPRVDRRFKDGETIRVGTTEVTAHVTGGHTRGCTTYTFPVRDGDRVLRVVSACSLIVLQGVGYRGYQADFERTFRVLRSLPADIWVTSHARLFGRYRKFVARTKTANPADAFIDPEGYRAYIDSGQARFRRGVVH
jgi:metallo-beta-lactamase class B